MLCKVDGFIAEFGEKKTNSTTREFQCLYSRRANKMVQVVGCAVLAPEGQRIQAHRTDVSSLVPRLASILFASLT